MDASSQALAGGLGLAVNSNAALEKKREYRYLSNRAKKEADAAHVKRVDRPHRGTPIREDRRRTRPKAHDTL